MSLRNWTRQRWVDVANKKRGGGYPPCGRRKGEKRRNYPKCLPIAKVRNMSAAQIAAAVRRKKKAEKE